MTSIQYNPLFTLELLHKFYANGACIDFTIQPSAQTAFLLRGNNIIAKQYQHELYTGIEVNTTANPFILPAEGAQFTFFLQLNNPAFFNYTNLPASFPRNKIYYFTNRNINSNNGKSFLSQPTPYNNTKNYKPGDIATTPGGVTFRAIRSNHNITPAPGNDWLEIDANRYLSDNDILTLLPSVSTYPFVVPQLTATIEVKGYNTIASDYSALVISKTISFIQAVNSFTLDLSSLQSGKYVLTVNGAEQMIYINDEIQKNKAFAVIDLYNDNTLPDDYRMFDGTTLRSPFYSIFFLNRATIWKYTLLSTNGTVSDLAGIYHFSSLPHTASSLSPIPLSEKALNLKLNIGTQEYSPIACASPQRLARFSTATDTYDCSEIFLNY